ncbi:MAG: SpaA isopeptide-forming pilin-related protein, partial [Oscillospiraceae bacterium]|nr:SpaA isopeptide-forming pilin-related protein [Oscillospiraceae bacterium]
MFKLHNNHITSKVILILLAIIMILPILSTLGVSAAASDAPATALTSGEEILIKSDDCDSSVGGTYYPHVIHLSGGSTRYPGIISSSDDIVTSNAYYVNGDGEKVFAFCIDPDKDGVAESGGSYYVTLSEKLTDKFEIAALKLSVRSDINDILYPGLSFANMDYWTSYAVKIAVKFYEMTGQDETKTLAEINNLTPVLSPTGSNMIPNVPDFGSKVIAAIKSAYNWITKNENTAAVTGEEYWIGEPEDDNHQRYVFITYSATPTETTETPTEPTTQPETTQPTTPAAPTTGSLKIGKINGMTGEPVPGTKFLVEQIDGTYSTTVTVGSDGYYIINDIPKGSYKITEVYVPEPLILDTTPKSVYIDPETATEDNPIVVEFVNDQMTCVHVYKYDSKTNEPLNGAQFKLSRKDETSAIYTGITGESQCSSDCGLCKTPCNADGMICFGPLAPGWYTVSEVNPAPGYILDLATSSVQTFEVTGKETQEIQLKFDNKRRPELKIIKKDSDGNHLAGVEFEIWKSGTQEKFSAKTDSNGEIYIPWDNTDYPLDEGAYSIREINVPAGYVLSDEVKEVMLVGNTLSEVVFVDPKKPGLTITKTDNDGNPLDGVTFEIWKSGTDTKHSATTIGGKIVLEWDNADFPLEAGSYSIREVSVTRGYLLDTTVKEALLENGKMVTVPFTNDKRPELEILKTDSAGKPLSGAVFTIKRTGTTTEYELTTDLSGKIVIPYDSPLYPLEPDRYIITEKNAPEHYLASENNSQEVILEPNTRKTVTFVDAEKPKLTIEKYDQRGDGNGNALPLSAVTFRIYKTDGSYDQTLTTGADGKIRITDLLPGEYHINEISTKDGYVLNTEVRTVILKGDDDVTETFYNLKRPELLIVKLDSKTGKPLANAHFQISKDNEVLFQDLVTDASGQILIPYNDKSRLLEEGVYKVTEIAPPPGYDLVLPASQNVVLRNGERTRVEFSDIRKPTLIITKLNALTKKPVPNTLYNIKWENPTGGVHDLGNWYTDKNGQIIFEFAEVGWYQITEIMPAPGMTKAKNPVTRIYLAPGTNAYSDNELRTADNSSG